tara:strand:+ start:745 stop:1431 length:687 start_codon:yes stop_codon:yes gene_type:complete
MKNLIIIPARKGSKRIKNKNILQVMNQPLIFWTINFAKKLNKKNFDSIVTSDCHKIKKICFKNKISFLKRSKIISGDNVSMHKVIFDTLKKLDKKYKYIILLQPTSPLRKLNLVRKAIKILNKNKSFDSFIHLAYEHTFTGKLKNNIWKPDYDINNRTQDLKDKLVPTGNLFIYRSSLYKKKIKLPKKTYGITSNNEAWIDIDTEKDLSILNFYLKKSKNRRILVYNT